MTQVVIVPNIGKVNFPDGMSPEKIADAIDRDLLPPAARETFKKHSAYAKAAPEGGYLTHLAPQEEGAFQQWVQQNNVPFDPSPAADYDMRGFYKALQAGDPRAKTGVNQNDSKLHFSDYWKTPFHKSFSNESQWATEAAPRWNEKDQLVLPDGRVVFDERARAAPEQQPVEGPSAMARVGRGMMDVGQGLKQRILQAASAPPQATPSIQELRAYANPEEQQLSDDQLRAKFQQQDPAASYTAKVNDELAIYNKGRAAQGGGVDLARIAGNVAASLPLSAVGPAGATVLARAGAGAVQGAASGAAQFAPSGDIKDTLVNTAVGAGTGAVVAPAVGALSDKALALGRKMVGAWRGATANADPADILKSIPEFQALPDAGRRDLIAEAQEQIRTTGALNAEQLARKANLIAQGVRPTKSMVTRNPADWSLERNLSKLAQSPDDQLSQTGQELTSLYQGNDKALAGKLAEMGKNLPKGTAEAHGMTVMKSLDELATASQEDVGKLYSAVRTAKGDQLASDARQLASTLDDLRDNTYAEKLVGSVTNKLRRFGMLDAEGNPTTNTLTVTQAEELRKFVNKLPNDFGKQDIIRAIDADVMSGMGEDAFAAARGAAKSRFAMLENPATQRALNTLGELTQGKTAQHFIKSQVIDAADQDVTSLVGTLSKLPKDQAGKAMDALKAGVLQHLEEAATTPNSDKFSGAALNKALDAIGERKLVAILGADQYGRLQNLARAALDATFEPPYSAVNHSNTAPMLMSLMQKARAVPGVPVLVTDEAQKMAARAGYRSQLASALAARSQAQLPKIPQGAHDLATLLRSGAATAPVAAANRRRPHR